jgi:glycosyltransferase involved in cell wall biosynthesis
MDKPLISVITPTYNHEKFISHCIDSVLNQSYSNWEMIIVDDGSTDHTAEIASEYSVKDSRIRVIRQENVGIFRLSETYNKALQNSSGNYIAILEGDDYWLENKLDKQIKAFESDPEAILCWGQGFSISSDKKTEYGLLPSTNSKDYPFFNNNPTGSILNMLFFKNYIPALTIMIKRDSLLKIGGFKQSCELPLIDLPTLFELSMIGPFVFIPSPLGIWRIYSTQVTKTYTSQLMEGYKCLVLQFYNRIKDQHILKAGIDEKTLRKHYDKQLIISYSRSGRYKLIRKEFNKARKDYFQSLFKFGFYEPVWKIRSLIGLLFSYFRMDVEGLSKILGKKTYS